MLKIIASGSVGVPKRKSAEKSAGKSMKSLLYALACRECRGYQSHAQAQPARIVRAIAVTHGRHQPGPSLRLSAAQLPDRAPGQPRRLFERLSRAPRLRRPGGDQG